MRRIGKMIVQKKVMKRKTKIKEEDVKVVKNGVKEGVKVEKSGVKAGVKVEIKKVNDDGDDESESEEENDEHIDVEEDE